MPSIAGRQSMRGRPPWLFGGGGASSSRIDSIRSQRASGTSQIVSSGATSRFVRGKAASPEVKVFPPQDTNPIALMF
jgi:hypothetical protein